MYAVGRPHVLKAPSLRILALAATSDTYFTSAEVFQELMYTYMKRGDWAEKHPLFADFLDLMAGRIEPLNDDDIRLAARMTATHTGLSARDLVHVAVMQRVGARYVVTADKGFDGVEGVERLDPARVDEWRSLVEA